MKSGPNRVAVGDNIAILFCSSPSGKVFGVTVDKEDLPRLSAAGTWRVANFDKARGGFKLYAYFARRVDGRSRITYMHRFILGLTDRRIEADHIYGRTLDNRKSQIRPATRSLNQRNKKRSGPANWCGVRGVFRMPSGRYRTRVSVDGKYKYLGTFDTPEQAGQAVAEFNRQLGVTIPLSEDAHACAMSPDAPSGYGRHQERASSLRGEVTIMTKIRYGIPGIGGSLGLCPVCGETFLKEILLHQAVGGLRIEGIEANLPVHDKCADQVVALQGPWEEVRERFPRGPLYDAYEEEAAKKKAEVT